MSRASRTETRSRHNEIKRTMHSHERVRRWEKKWVTLEDTSMQIYKWVPIRANEQSSIETQHLNLVQQHELSQGDLNGPNPMEADETKPQNEISFDNAINSNGNSTTTDLPSDPVQNGLKELSGPTPALNGNKENVASSKDGETPRTAGDSQREISTKHEASEDQQPSTELPTPDSDPSKGDDDKLGVDKTVGGGEKRKHEEDSGKRDDPPAKQPRVTEPGAKED